MASQNLSGKPVGNAVIGQSGGPTAVINQSLVGIIESLRGNQEVQRIYGMLHGVAGLLYNDLIELGSLHDGLLSIIASTPSAALGTTRDKPDAEYCQHIFEACERQNIRYFYYIGGNDSSDTLRIVSEMARKSDYALRCFHIPKTIDNDLPQSDHTPGYPSAAKFVVQAFMGDNLDNRALPGIKINVVMGRHAGWLTAASALARKFPGDGPHLIYLPEVPFQVERFLTTVEDVYNSEGRCVIAVSEGICTEQGVPIIKAATEELKLDQHGNVQLSGTGVLGDYLANLIKSKVGKSVRVRADTFGYLQRAFCGVFSEVDAQEARQCGRMAVNYTMQGVTDGSIAIRRVNNMPYEVVYDCIKLTEVAAQTRKINPEFISGDHDVSEDFIKYLKPLIGKLPVIGRLY